MAIALGVVGILVVSLGMAWVFRRFVLWYWRIPEICDRLQAIDESLRTLPAAREWRARRMAAERPLGPARVSERRS